MSVLSVEKIERLTNVTQYKADNKLVYKLKYITAPCTYRFLVK